MNTCNYCGIKIYKKETEICHKCKKTFCGEHAFTYVDGNNKAITLNSKIYCEKCYKEVYK